MVKPECLHSPSPVVLLRSRNWPVVGLNIQARDTSPWMVILPPAGGGRWGSSPHSSRGPVLQPRQDGAGVHASHCTAAHPTLTLEVHPPAHVLRHHFFRVHGGPSCCPHCLEMGLWAALPLFQRCLAVRLHVMHAPLPGCASKANCAPVIWVAWQRLGSCFFKARDPWHLPDARRGFLALIGVPASPQHCFWHPRTMIAASQRCTAFARPHASLLSPQPFLSGRSREFQGPHCLRRASSPQQGSFLARSGVRRAVVAMAAADGTTKASTVPAAACDVESRPPQGCLEMLVLPGAGAVCVPRQHLPQPHRGGGVHQGGAGRGAGTKGARRLRPRIYHA